MSKAEIYEQGYRDGESNVAADWAFALGELLPDGVEPVPSQVARYIKTLHSVIGQLRP